MCVCVCVCGWVKILNYFKKNLKNFDRKIIWWFCCCCCCRKIKEPLVLKMMMMGFFFLIGQTTTNLICCCCCCEGEKYNRKITRNKFWFCPNNNAHLYIVNGKIWKKMKIIFTETNKSYVYAPLIICKVKKNEPKAIDDNEEWKKNRQIDTWNKQTNK